MENTIDIDFGIELQTLRAALWINKVAVAERINGLAQTQMWSCSI